MKAITYISVFLLFSLLCAVEAPAQNVAGSWASAGVACAANNAGSSTLLLSANGTRVGFFVNNDSSTATRVGGTSACSSACQSATPVGAVLNDTNSMILNPGATINDGPPGQYYNYLFCQSTTASTNTIHTVETRYP